MEKKEDWTIEEMRPIIERYINNKKFSEILFVLYTSYGFPVELSIEELNDRGYNFDRNIVMEGFNVRMKEHKEISRIANKGVFVSPLSN